MADKSPMVAGSDAQPTTNGAATDENAAVDPHSLQELTSFIQNLLQQTQDRFLTMSDHIIKRIDEMGRRIDDLEKNINDLMTQAGVDGQGEN